MINWTLAVRDIQLELWDDGGWSESDSIIKVALKMVENSIASELVARLYTRLDSKDLYSTKRVSAKEIRTTINVLKRVPYILFDENDNGCYGSTDCVKNPTIHINQKMIEYSQQDNIPHVEKYRLCLMIFVTILHELGHKIRKRQYRDSPKKIFPSMKHRGIGEYIEQKLFGGVITCETGPKYWNGKLILTRKTADDFIEVIEIDDDWLSPFVNGVIHNNFTLDDFKPLLGEISSKRMKMGKTGRYVNEEGRHYIV